MAGDEIVMASRRSWGPWGCIMLGCAGTLLVVVLGIGSCAAYLYQGKRALDPYADQFFAAWDSEDYSALEAMGVPYQGTRGSNDMLDRIQEQRRELGPVVSRSQRGINITSANGEQDAVLTYQARFENGTRELELHFRKTGEAWELESVDFGTDAEARELRCPHCGSHVEVGSNFCSACGAALGVEVERGEDTIDL